MIIDMITKVKIIMKNRWDKIRHKYTETRHRHKYTKYIKCISKALPVCIKQHLPWDEKKTLLIKKLLVFFVYGDKGDNIFKWKCISM